MNKPTRPFSYYELLDASQETGCPLCRIGQTAVARHLDATIYDSVNSISLRDTLRKSRGYCHEHAWQLPHAGGSAPLGIAIIYRDVLNTLNKELDAAKFKSSRLSLRSMREAVSRGEPSSATAETIARTQPQAQCPACERQEEVEHLAFIALTDALAASDQGMLDALTQAETICFPHLRQALAYTRDKTGYTHLVRIMRDKIEALIGDLDEFMRKNDHRFRDEPISETERVSWQRALYMLVGQNDYPEQD